ncbi:MAG: hypothetical protein M3Y87_08210 [Myxococcota bacterium]|nr:hypothetical protein [Myxococcota bacterium]
MFAAALDLFQRLQRAVAGPAEEEAARAVDDAKRDALRVARELRHGARLNAEALDGQRATRRAVEEVLDAGARNGNALELYALAARQTRALLGELDRARKLAAIIDDLAALCRRAGVAHDDLTRAQMELRDVLARGAQERDEVLAFLEDVEDIIAIIEAEREQGDEPLIPQDELLRRLNA